MNKLDSFKRNIVIKCMPRDKVNNSMQDYMSEDIGKCSIELQVILLFYINIRMMISNLCFIFEI